MPFLVGVYFSNPVFPKNYVGDNKATFQAIINKVKILNTLLVKIQMERLKLVKMVYKFCIKIINGKDSVVIQLKNMENG